MAKMNYNRPVHRQIDEWKKDKFKNENQKPEVNPIPFIANRFTFGKYKGKLFSEVPTSYLEWLISVTKEDYYAIRYARELARRPNYKPRP